MKKFIKISWSYYSTYEKYTGEFVLPVKFLQSIIHQEIRNEDDLELLFNKIKENMRIRLGWINEDYRLVILESEDIDVKLTNSYIKPSLGTTEYATLMTTIVEAIFCDGFYHLDSQYCKEFHAANYLYEEMIDYEQDNLSTVDSQETEQSPDEIMEEIDFLVDKYKRLTGKLPTIE